MTECSYHQLIVDVNDFAVREIRRDDRWHHDWHIGPHLPATAGASFQLVQLASWCLRHQSWMERCILQSL